MLVGSGAYFYSRTQEQHTIAFLKKLHFHGREKMQRQECAKSRRPHWSDTCFSNHVLHTTLDVIRYTFPKDESRLQLRKYGGRDYSNNHATKLGLIATIAEYLGTDQRQWSVRMRNSRLKEELHKEGVLDMMNDQLATRLHHSVRSPAEPTRESDIESDVTLPALLSDLPALESDPLESEVTVYDADVVPPLRSKVEVDDEHDLEHVKPETDMPPVLPEPMTISLTDDPVSAKIVGSGPDDYLTVKALLEFEMKHPQVRMFNIENSQTGVDEHGTLQTYAQNIRHLFGANIDVPTYPMLSADAKGNCDAIYAELTEHNEYQVVWHRTCSSHDADLPKGRAALNAYLHERDIPYDLMGNDTNIKFIVREAGSTLTELRTKSRLVSFAQYETFDVRKFMKHALGTKPCVTGFGFNDKSATARRVFKVFICPNTSIPLWAELYAQRENLVDDAVTGEGMSASMWPFQFVCTSVPSLTKEAVEMNDQRTYDNEKQKLENGRFTSHVAWKPVELFQKGKTKMLDFASGAWDAVWRSLSNDLVRLDDTHYLIPVGISGDELNLPKSLPSSDPNIWYRFSFPSGCSSQTRKSGEKWFKAQSYATLRASVMAVDTDDVMNVLNLIKK